VSWGEASHLEGSRNSIDPAAPSGSMGILATTDRGFPSRTHEYWSAPSGFTGILATTYRGFPSRVSFFFFIFFYIIYLLLHLLPTYPPVSSLPPRSTYLLERPLHVFVVCSPCCFYEAPYTAPVPYPSTTVDESSVAIITCGVVVVVVLVIALFVITTAGRVMVDCGVLCKLVAIAALATAQRASLPSHF